MTARVAALFDMDKTLLRVDTATSWSRFLYARGELSTRMLAKATYWSLLYKLAVLDMETVFSRLVADLEGDSEAEMIETSTAWFRDHIAPAIAPAARVAAWHHQQAGEVLVLATGSTQYAARPVAAACGIDHVLSSVLEVREGRFTGHARPCFGHHKVAMVERWATEHEVDLARSTFYSDSFNDLPLLARVGTPIAVNPDARLRRHALRHGWPIQIWH